VAGVAGVADLSVARHKRNERGPEPHPITGPAVWSFHLAPGTSASSATSAAVKRPGLMLAVHGSVGWIISRQLRSERIATRPQSTRSGDLSTGHPQPPERVNKEGC